MINPKSIIAVIIIAILVGVLYVLFEKSLFGTNSLSQTQFSSSGEKKATSQVETVTQQNTILALPSPESFQSPINESSDLLKEAEGLQMRDYSGYFEDLKDKAQQ